jgi:hypothetical protein
MREESGPNTDLTATLERLVDSLPDLLAKRMAERLGGGLLSAEYTTRSLPPGMSRRTFVDNCKHLAGAGDKRVWRRGRLWVAKREAIDEQPARRRAPVQAFGGPWSPQEALEAAGVRAQRK